MQYKGHNTKNQVGQIDYDTRIEEVKVFIEEERPNVRTISPIEKLVRNEVVKWFSMLVKTEPNKKLEDLISIAKDDIKNQLIQICYNL